MKRSPIWSWFWFIIGVLYFFIPLISTLEFSMRMIRGKYTFEAYRVAFQDPDFYKNFGYSMVWAVLTIIISLLLVVPTAYWVQLKLPKWRPYVEFVTLLPFVIPAVVLTFGLLRLYGPCTWGRRLIRGSSSAWVLTRSLGANGTGAQEKEEYGCDCYHHCQRKCPFHNCLSFYKRF